MKKPFPKILPKVVKIKIAIKSPNRLMHARKTPPKKLKISMNRVKMFYDTQILKSRNKNGSPKTINS
jgi:hypothetical protein